MAIVCDRCKTENVITNGMICQKCLDQEADSKIDHSYMEKVYLPPELFDRFQKLHADVEAEKGGARKALGKFMSVLKTSFIHPFTGREILDPTPKVIIPKERTLDRIQKILNHNLAVYARQHDLDTPEDLDDWSVSDMYSDSWEQSLYQYVESVQMMAEDHFSVSSDSVSSAPTPGPEPINDGSKTPEDKTL